MKIVHIAVFSLIMAFACVNIYAADNSTKTPVKYLSDKHIDKGFQCGDCHDGIEKPEKGSGIQSCLDCHGGYKGMAEASKDLEINPHDSHNGDLECSECHQGHKESIDYCGQCHAYGLVVP